MSKFTDFVEKMAQEMRCFVPFDRQSAYYLTSEEVKALIKEKKNLQRIMKNMRKVVA